MALDLIIILVAAITGGWLFGDPLYDVPDMIMGVVLGGWFGLSVILVLGFMNM